MRWPKAKSHMSSFLILVNSLFIQSTSLFAFTFSSKKALQLAVPLQIELPLPTRGGADKKLEEAVITADGNTSVVSWKNMKPFPASKVDCKSTISLVQNISSKDDVLIHFLKTNEINPEIFYKGDPTSSAVTVSEFNGAQFIEINLTKAGWRPGKTTVYILSPHRNRTILIEPTWHLRFDWGRANINW